jgi:cytochrome c5
MSRRARVWRGAWLLIAAGAWGCAAATPAPREAADAAAPADEGRRLLERACTTCHDLGGLDAYKGYWGERQWADMVATMIDHGAALDDAEAAVLVDHLTATYGPDAP